MRRRLKNQPAAPTASRSKASNRNNLDFVRVEGTIAPEATEGPDMLVAVTVKVYLVPLLRPVTVHEVVADVQVRLPGLEVTV